ncbi:SDR family oxidoreductase [Salipaludibacillus agaradhaerens]|uniref:SDR family oxidoreductase n=1 Tax=Salipaludibacillus agaradhaerens TaxID=76935 RepID=UPI00215174B8|nr:SDR family oxidoreductase [Salipaludibacillus agaradhaerens]MCR6108464.1 SDR family oxidoreductase [Salipaludibacillus agaradhaerens]MCR6120485.1 SDR family oxidoreductase [Salipaludibacillus agaradhaerens]
MNIFISQGEQKLNQMIARHFHQKGETPVLLFTDRDKHREFMLSQPNQATVFCDTFEEDVLDTQIAEAFGMSGVDVLIHGNEMLDEAKKLEEHPFGLDEHIRHYLHRIFLLNKVVVRQMIQPKKGHIIFPLFYDPLYYAEYVSSPILNQAKLSLMKCMSRELGPFKLNVNAITFGYYNDGFDRQERKARKEKVEIFSLKPKLPDLDEYVKSIELLVHPSANLIGGENLHVGAGIETGI